MILDEIVAVTKVRVQKKHIQTSYEEIKNQANVLAKREINKTFLFEKALSTDEISLICEVKKASPSKGVITKEFPYKEIALEYQKAGASCISVLTEPNFFQGNDKYLKDICELVSIPVLRKDFVIDDYQIYEAKVLGASCVLLICALHDEEKLEEYINICDSLGLSALVEAHDEKEIEKAVKAGARIIGVNNRDLKTFQVDITNSIRLRNKVPDHILFVAESGIRNADDIKQLKDAGVNGVLIGETMMRCADKKQMVQNILGGGK